MKNAYICPQCGALITEFWRDDMFESHTYVCSSCNCTIDVFDNGAVSVEGDGYYASAQRVHRSPKDVAVSLYMGSLFGEGMVEFNTHYITLDHTPTGKDLWHYAQVGFDIARQIHQMHSEDIVLDECITLWGQMSKEAIE